MTIDCQRNDISNCFSSSACPLREVRTADAVLYNGQVERRMNAMAAFDMPSAVGVVVPQAVQNELSSTLVVTWQAA